MVRFYRDLIDACMRDRARFDMDPWKERMARIVADRDAERREKTAGLISESLGGDTLSLLPGVNQECPPRHARVGRSGRRRGGAPTPVRNVLPGVPPP